MERARSLVWIGIAAAVVAQAAAAEPEAPAVTTAAPAWIARFEQPVRWHRVQTMGPLVVATDCCLHGIDPTSGAVAWKREVAGLVEDSFEPIPGTPLFVIATGGEGNRTLVIDATDGHGVFDSKVAGIAGILHRTVLFESGGLLILGRERDDPTIKLFLADMTTGEIRWVNDQVLGDLSPAMNKIAGLLAAMVQETGQPGATSASTARPVEVGRDAVVVTDHGEIVKLSTTTGEFLWRAPNRDGGGKSAVFLVPQRPDLFLVGTESATGASQGEGQAANTLYGAYRLADGTALWPKSVKVNGALTPPLLLADAAILSPGGGTKGNLKRVEYDSGRSTWGKEGKGIPTDGGIVDHQSTAAGLVVTTGHDSAWTNKGTAYSLNVLDVTAGAFRYPKSLKVQGRLLRTEVLARGVLYETTHEVGIFDPESGTSLLPRPIVSQSLVTADAGAMLYVFAADEGALWRVDEAEPKATRLTTEKIELEGDDVPTSLEVGGDRVTLLGSQHVIGFDRQGKTLFRKYHPAPRHPGWVRALAIAQSVRAGMAAAGAGLTAAAFSQYAQTQEDGTLEREMGEEIAQGYANAAEGVAGLSAGYARLAKERFQASAEARDFQFMMVKIERGYGIAQVGKTDGEIHAVIPIGRDKAPSYQVDDVAERVYYQPDDHAILGYAFRR